MIDGQRLVPGIEAEVRAAMAMHDLRDPLTVHDNLQANECACRRLFVIAQLSQGGIMAKHVEFNTNTGDACVSCGSTDMIRTGTCMTCHSCGASGGCA